MANVRSRSLVAAVVAWYFFYLSNSGELSLAAFIMVVTMYGVIPLLLSKPLDRFYGAVGRIAREPGRAFTR